MIYILIGIMFVLIIILILLVWGTSTKLDARVSQNEEYLKNVSEENKQLKIFLKNEVPMANSGEYPVFKNHLPYKPYSDSGE